MDISASIFFSPHLGLTKKKAAAYQAFKQTHLARAALTIADAQSEGLILWKQYTSRLGNVELEAGFHPSKVLSPNFPDAV
jgi:hypothetical protein